MTRQLALLALLAVAVACGNGGDGPPTPDAAAHAALCDAIDAADAGDADAAAAMFTDRIHDQLHDLAGRTEDSNRTAAARLLEAKAAVEAAAPADLAGVLTELDAAMVNAIRATGGDAPNRCE